MSLRALLLTAFALSLPVVLACGCGSPTEGGTLRVAVSVLPHAWLVEQIGGEHVDVVPLVLPGESPHSYQPTDAQVSAVLRARVYFRTGVPFEYGPWLDALEDAPGMRVVDLRAGLALRDMEAHEHGHDDVPPAGPDHDHDHGHDHDHAASPEDHGHADTDARDPYAGRDPHVWLAPRLIAAQARTIQGVLAELDPAHADAYAANLGVFLAALDRVDRTCRDLLAPYAGRRVYVFHPAWGYFLEAYGLFQVAIETEGKEPLEAELTDLVRRGREDRVRVVFVQSQVQGRAAEALARALGAEVRYLDPLAPDLDENLVAIARAIAAALE